MLILGLGNEDRSDDAAGLLATRKLAALGFDTCEPGNDPLALIESWSHSAYVILIDATMSGAAPGTIHVWDVRSAPLPPGRYACSTHALGVAEAIEIARALDRLPPKFIFYGIEGLRFEPGGAPSPAVLEAVERLVRQVAQK